MNTMLQFGVPRKTYKFKLLYFEDRGTADLVRLIFAVAQHQYEAVKIKQSEWNHFRMFMPFEQLPVLLLNDEIRIAQTNSICRFLASYFNMSGIGFVQQFYMICGTKF
jgi:glutathione S-transferase